MTSWAGSESTADGQRERETGRRWRQHDSSDERSWGGGWMRGRWLRCDSPCCHQRDRGPWVALSIPTWEAWKWRGRVVIIYSLQLLTLDSELITAKGKSDWTWRVPESVTLISVRCLQQEVREDVLASVGSFCRFVRAHMYMFVYTSQVGMGGPRAEWLNHNSIQHVVELLMGQFTAHCAFLWKKKKSKTVLIKQKSLCLSSHTVTHITLGKFQQGIKNVGLHGKVKIIIVTKVVWLAVWKHTRVSLKIMFFSLRNLISRFDYLFFPSELVTRRLEGGHKITGKNISGPMMKMHSSPTKMLFGRVKWLISHLYRSSPKEATSHSQGGPVSSKTGGSNKMSKQQPVLCVGESLEV